MATELSNETLAAAIEEGLKAAKSHVQVTLFFMSEEDVRELDYSPEHWPVGSVSVEPFDLPGGCIARGGEHVDFPIDKSDTRTPLEIAVSLMDAADSYAGDNLSSPWDLSAEEGHRDVTGM